MSTVLPDDAAGDDYCYLVTRGRVTGDDHEIEIWFAADTEDRSTVFMLAGGGHRADWVRNLRAEPAASVRVRAMTYRATGRVVVDDGEARRARDLVFTKYQARYDGDLSSWRESALPVAVDLDAPA